MKTRDRVSFCFVTGSIRDLNRELGPLKPHLHGSARASFRYVSSSDDHVPLPDIHQLKNLEADLHIFSETWPTSTPSIPRTKHAASAATLCFRPKNEENPDDAYGIDLMMTESSFEAFKVFVDDHFGQDIRFLIGFQVHDFAEGADGRPPSFKQFIAGRALQMDDVPINATVTAANAYNRRSKDK